MLHLTPVPTLRWVGEDLNVIQMLQNPDRDVCTQYQTSIITFIVCVTLDFVFGNPGLQYAPQMTIRGGPRKKNQKLTLG